MKIKKVGANMTELNKDDGTVVFFSYETPVAAFVVGRGYLRTKTKYSVTTSKHINKYLSEVAKYVTLVEQSEIDALVK